MLILMSEYNSFSNEGFILEVHLILKYTIRLGPWPTCQDTLFQRDIYGVHT